jgi:hypothetical protein
MSLYYVLADTAVNGEIIIQGVSVTYSATATAFDSSNTSFKDAAKVATIHSNAAAIVATRKVIDNILIEYAYVLSDLAITSLINNSLKTNIHPIIPVALASIASSKDGINYILDASYELPVDHMLTIPNKKTLTVPGNLTFNSNGYLFIGDSQTTESKPKATTTECTCAAGSLTYESTEGQKTVTLAYTTLAPGACFTAGTNINIQTTNIFYNEGCVRLSRGDGKAGFRATWQNKTGGYALTEPNGKFFTNVDLAKG